MQREDKESTLDWSDWLKVNRPSSEVSWWFLIGKVSSFCFMVYIGLWSAYVGTDSPGAISAVASCAKFFITVMNTWGELIERRKDLWLTVQDFSPWSPHCFWQNYHGGERTMEQCCLLHGSRKQREKDSQRGKETGKTHPSNAAP
jgi:hypothetical protein